MNSQIVSLKSGGWTYSVKCPSCGQEFTPTWIVSGLLKTRRTIQCPKCRSYLVSGRITDLNKPSLIYVKYLDHVLFRNADPSLLRPCIREVVGWLVRETDELLCLCYDRAVDQPPFGKPTESGFIILKSDVLETRRVEMVNRPDV